MDVNELQKIFDPNGRVWRIWFMLAFNEEIPSAPVPAPPRAVVFHNGFPNEASRRKAVTSEQKDRTDIWVESLSRVRDTRDRAAFAELFEHFAPRIKGFLMKSGADATTAEECAQDVMARVWQKAEQFDPSRASVATWVFTIARNRRIDMLRRSKRPEPEDLPWGPEPEPDQADVIALQQDSQRLAAALLDLPQAQRDLIEKAYFGDLSQSEIADITGLPLGTIKSRIRLALDRLRHAMK